MQGECMGADGSLLTSRDVHQTHDAAMRSAVQDGHLAEILVQDDQNAVLGVSAGEDFVVARVLGPIAGPDDIVAPALSSAAAPPHTHVSRRTLMSRSRS